MHDCPTCQVPLHGHEEVCPSCGTKQYVRPEYRHSNLPKPPGVNPWPFIIALVVIGIAGVFAAQNSWVGQLLTRPPEKVDPIDNMSISDARKMVEQQITQGLTTAGATGKFTYMSQGKPADISAQGAIELTIDTKLADPNQHKTIIDPIKPYMPKAQIITLTMNDEKSHATWTYNVSPPRDNDEDKAPLDTSGSQSSSGQQ